MTSQAFYNAKTEPSASFDMDQRKDFMNATSYGNFNFGHDLGRLAEQNKAQMHEVLRSGKFQRTANNFYLRPKALVALKHNTHGSKPALLKVVNDSRQDSYQSDQIAQQHLTPMQYNTKLQTTARDFKQAYGADDPHMMGGMKRSNFSLDNKAHAHTLKIEHEKRGRDSSAQRPHTQSNEKKNKPAQANTRKFGGSTLFRCVKCATAIFSNAEVLDVCHRNQAANNK